MDSNNANTENISLKTCSGCLKIYAPDFFDGKKTCNDCNACRPSNKNRRVTSRTNRKRHIEEKHEKIKPNDHIYFEDLADVIIENITKLKENVHLIGKNNLKLSGKS